MHVLCIRHYEKNGLAYCMYHYHQLFGTLCHHCNGVIQVTRAGHVTTATDRVCGAGRRVYGAGQGLVPAPPQLLRLRQAARPQDQVLRGGPAAGVRQVLRQAAAPVPTQAQAVPRAGDQEGEGDQGWTVEMNFRKFLIKKQIDTQINR